MRLMSLMRGELVVPAFVAGMAMLASVVMTAECRRLAPADSAADGGVARSETERIGSPEVEMPPDEPHAGLRKEVKAPLAEVLHCPLAFAGVQRETVVVEISDAVVEADGTLSGHLKACILEHAKSCGVRHVRVQDTARLGDEAVHRQMNMKSSVLDQPAPGHNLAAEVELHQVARLDLRPQKSERCEVEPVGVSGDQHRQVIVDAFVEAEAGSETMAGGEIDPRLAFGIAA